MQYITVKQAAEKWGLSDRRVRVLCEQGAVAGAVRVGRNWNVPASAEKPDDRRRKPENAEPMEQVEALKQKLQTLRPLTAGELQRLNEEFTVEYTYNSNAIEGNTLTLRETELVLRGLTIGEKPLKDHLEAVGHKEAFDYICGLVQKNEPLTERVVKEVHSLVLADKPQDKGVYRRVPVRIMSAVHVPPEPFCIAEQMQALLSDYQALPQKDIVAIAKFHLLFEGIHPFIDGNGRTGRLIANLELMKLGYWPINIKFEDRIRYYNAFDAYFGTGDALPMRTLFMEYEKERLSKIVEVLRVGEHA